MTDMFLSYSRQDSRRVATLHKALVDHGFIVFWDQTIPKGMDWNDWIRDKLAYARVAVIVWSKTSTVSYAVIHEAEIARDF
jgi:hypothetical protein